MLRDITLGQFFPGSSVLHKTDPRVKILLAIAYIVAVFLVKSPSGYIFLSAFTITLVLISGVKAKVVLKGIKPLIFIVIFTAVINIFFTKGENLLVSWWIINIYAEGLANALFMSLRIISLLVGTSVILTYTTSPIALTDAIERLLSPLRVLHIPVHEFAMMMTIALRFIPTLIEETDKIMSAQKSRGADFQTGKLHERVRAFVPVLIPLFVSAFRRADDLAVAMECRCYRGGRGRTRMTKLHLHLRDLFAVVVMAAFIAGIVVLNKYLPLNFI